MAADTPSGDRILAGAARARAARITALALLGLAQTGLALLLPFVLGHALDLLLRDRPAAGWVSICAAVVAGQVLLGAASDMLGATTVAATAAGLRRTAIAHVLAAGAPAARRGAGDLVSRLVGNAADAAAAPAAAAALPATVAAPIGGIVALALTDPWLAAAFVVGAPPLALLVQRFARASSDCVTRYQEAQGRIAARLVEALGGARTIAAARTEEREAVRVLGPLPELSAQGHRMWRAQGRATAQAAVLVPLLQILVLAVGGVRLGQGAISPGDLLAASRYGMLATGIGAVVGQLGGLVRGRAAARRLADVLAVPVPAYGQERLPKTTEELSAPRGAGRLAPARPAGPARPAARPAGTLEFRTVTVRRGGETVLDRLDLTVPGGACVAVVGRSGAGKSVLAALAGRLTDPDDGAVALDGIPLPRLSRSALRDAVGYAFERPVLLGATVADAIAFGPRPVPSGRTATAAARRARTASSGCCPAATRPPGPRRRCPAGRSNGSAWHGRSPTPAGC